MSARFPIRQQNGSGGSSPAAIPVWSYDAELLDPGRSFSGSVTRLFRHAAVAAPATGGSLLTLLHYSRPLVPLGVRIPWELARPAAGGSVTLAGRQLALRCADARQRILLLQGEGVSLRFPTRRARVSPAVLAEQLRQLAIPPRSRALVGEGALSTGSGSVEREVIRLATQGLRRIALLLCQADASAESYGQAVSSLAGLGPGLTPTGDDLLAGLAAAGCHFARSGLIDERSLFLYLRALSQLPEGSTTRTGREMLAHASQRRFPEPLLQFARSLGEPGAAGKDLGAQAARLVGMGGQSGADLLAGVVALAQTFRKAGGK